MSEVHDKRFLLDESELHSLSEISTLIRKYLSQSTPGIIRAASVLLLALERLPLYIPGVSLTLGFKTPDRNGNWGWVDVEYGDEMIILSHGEHYYDPSVGGDTESANSFEAIVGNHTVGSIENWLEMASDIAQYGIPTLEIDESDHDVLNDYFEQENSS